MILGNNISKAYTNLTSSLFSSHNLDCMFDNRKSLLIITLNTKIQNIEFSAQSCGLFSTDFHSIVLFYLKQLSTAFVCLL